MANQFLCSISGCDKPLKTRGLCVAHYTRLRRNGDPLSGRAAHGEPQRYYREAVLPYEGNECLIWPYSKMSNGYGQIRINGKLCTVSRLLCEDVNGPPDNPNDHAAHSCGRGMDACVTKAHIQWKTKSENEKDKINHGTHNRGSQHPLSKLTEIQIREIRALKGKETQQATADRYGVANQAISKIQARKSWQSLPE